MRRLLVLALALTSMVGVLGAAPRASGHCEPHVVFPAGGGVDVSCKQSDCTGVCHLHIHSVSPPDISCTCEDT